MTQWIQATLFIVTLIASISATQQNFQVVVGLDKGYVTDPTLCDDGSKVGESQASFFVSDIPTVIAAIFWLFA